MRFITYSQWKHPDYNKIWEHMYIPNEDTIRNPGQFDIQALMIPNDVGPNQWNTDDE